MSITQFVTLMGAAVGFTAYVAMSVSDPITTGFFGAMCLLAGYGLSVAVSATENLKELALTNAKLDILKELQS